ncbi:hypothetical protein GC175_23350 [bacterium]|nr:hypothetical protein [bacterium]
MKSSLRPLVLLCLLLAALLLSSYLAFDAEMNLFAQSPQETPPPQDPPPPVQTTPTATKPAVRNEITFPEADDVVFGVMRVRGTALINSYRRYEVHLGRNGSNSWQWLHSDFKIVRDSDLAVVNTTLYEDGFYDLRVRAINSDGNYSESFVRGFEIRNENPPTPTPTSSITATIEVSGTATLPPLSPIQTPVPPTSTPTPGSFIPNGQGIYTPSNGDNLSGSVRVIGTANGKDVWHRFQRYEIYLSPTGQETWEWLFSSQNQYFNDTLYVFDTTQLANGFYDLRLRIVYQDSNYDEYYVRRLRVENDSRVQNNPFSLIRITSPQEGSRLSGIIDITGTIVHPRLQRWELYWAEETLQENDQEWRFLFRGDYQVVNDLIARLDLRQIPAGVYDLRVRVVRIDGNYTDYIIRRLHVALPTTNGQSRP